MKIYSDKDYTDVERRFKNDYKGTVDTLVVGVTYKFKPEFVYGFRNLKSRWTSDTYTLEVKTENGDVFVTKKPLTDGDLK